LLTDVSRFDFPWGNEEKAASKILEKLFELDNDLGYQYHYYSNHTSSGIGPNTMLHVILKQKNTRWKHEDEVELRFDVTDYGAW
jgi:hypothetical protein